MNSIDFFKKGYKIYIKPKNRGKFTLTKKRTGKTTEELTHSKNPLTRKRAIFAQNAKKWKHKNGGELGLDGMIKARLALDSHFGNPTARRMTNYDTRSYTFPNGKRGNVYVGSYGEYVTPHIQDIDGELKFIENPWSKDNWRRSEAQSMKFENSRDAEYFAKNYKRFAPMMNLYSKGGNLNSNLSNKFDLKKQVETLNVNNGSIINPNDLLGILSNIIWKYDPNEAYTDKSNNTIVYNTPESIYHEYYGHMNPDTLLLLKLLPWYDNLSDERLQELGADLLYVKRTGDPGVFYLPEELLGRILAAFRMLPENSNYSPEFFENIRKTKHLYGDNIRDLLHMYNNENLSEIFKLIIPNKSKPKLIKKHRNGNYLKIKTPSNKQLEYFIEFLKLNDPEVIDLAEDLLHGIYPQLPITEKQLNQFIKEGKKEEEHYLLERMMENSRKEREEFLKKLEEDKNLWELEKKRRKKLWENSRKYAKEKEKETYLKTDPDSPKYDSKYAQELAVRHGGNLETLKDTYNFFAELFSPKPITEPIKSAIDRERAKELYEESMKNTEKFFDALGAITGVGGLTTRFVPSMTLYALPTALTGMMVDATSAIVNPDAENISLATGGLFQTVGATDAFRRIPGRWGIGLDTASDYIGTVFDLYGIGKPIIKSATK